MRILVVENFAGTPLGQVGTALDEAGWFAVRAMVRQSEVIEAMEKLDQIGASAILETSIVNCRL